MSAPGGYVPEIVQALDAAVKKGNLDALEDLFANPDFKKEIKRQVNMRLDGRTIGGSAISENEHFTPIIFAFRNERLSPSVRKDLIRLLFNYGAFSDARPRIIRSREIQGIKEPRPYLLYLAEDILNDKEIADMVKEKYREQFPEKYKELMAIYPKYMELLAKRRGEAPPTQDFSAGDSKRKSDDDSKSGSSKDDTKPRDKSPGGPGGS